MLNIPHLPNFARGGSASGLCLVLIIALAAPAAGQHAQHDHDHGHHHDHHHGSADAGDIEAFFADVAARLPGNFTNQAQIDAAVADGNADAEKDRRFMRMTKVTAPALGEHVYYLEWRRPDADGAISRQRIWSFHADQSGAPRMKFFTIRNPEPLAGQPADSAVFAGLRTDDLIGYPEACDVNWYRTDDGVWHGRIPAGACTIVTQRTGRTMTIDAHVELLPDRFHYDEAGTLDGGIVAFDVPQTLTRFEAMRTE